MTPALRELLVLALFTTPPNLATGRGANHGRAPMRRPYHYRRPNPDRRRALELLAVGWRRGHLPKSSENSKANPINSVKSSCGI